MVFDCLAERALGFPLVSVGCGGDSSAVEAVVNDLVSLLETDISESSRCRCVKRFRGRFHRQGMGRRSDLASSISAM